MSKKHETSSATSSQSKKQKVDNTESHDEQAEQTIKDILKAVHDELSLMEADVCDSWGKETWIEDMIGVEFPIEQIIILQAVDSKGKLAMKLTNELCIFILGIVSFYHENDSAGRITVCEKMSKDIIHVWNSILATAQESNEFTQNVDELNADLANVYKSFDAHDEVTESPTTHLFSKNAILATLKRH